MNLHRLIFLLFSLPFTLTALEASAEKVSAKAFLYAGRKMVLRNCDIASAKCGNEQLKIRKQDPSPNDENTKYTVLTTNGLTVEAIIRHYGKKKDFDIVKAIATNGKWDTSYGLNIGSSKNKVLSALGKPNEISNENHCISYVFFNKKSDANDTVEFCFSKDLVTKITWDYGLVCY